MRKTLLLTLLLAAWLAPAHAQDPAPDAGALTGMLNDFLAGASGNSLQAHETFWAEDLVYTSSSGARFGKADILEGIRASANEPPPENPPTYSAEDVRIQQYGDTAIVAFRLVGSTPTDGGAPEVANYFNTGTFLRRDGRWQVVAWQATRIPEE